MQKFSRPIGPDNERGYTLCYPDDKGRAELAVFDAESGEVRATFHYCPRLKVWERVYADAGGFPVRQTYHAKHIVHGAFRFGRSDKFNEVMFMRSPGAQRLLEEMKSAEEWALEDEAEGQSQRVAYDGNARSMFEAVLQEARNAKLAQKREALPAPARGDSVPQGAVAPVV